MRLDHMPADGRATDDVPTGYSHVLRRPEWDPSRAYRHPFYTWVSVSRTVEHPDGVTAATHFVHTANERMKLEHRGWQDVTEQWMSAHDPETGQPRPVEDRAQTAQERPQEPQGRQDTSDTSSDAQAAPDAQDDPSSEDSDTPGWSTERIEALSYRDLQQELKALDVNAAGTLGDLRQRLADAVGL